VPVLVLVAKNAVREQPAVVLAVPTVPAVLAVLAVPVVPEAVSVPAPVLVVEKAAVPAVVVVDDLPGRRTACVVRVRDADVGAEGQRHSGNAGHAKQRGAPSQSLHQVPSPTDRDYIVAASVTIAMRRPNPE